MAACYWSHGSDPLRAKARHQASLAHTVDGPSTGQGRGCRTGQQNRPDRVGHDGARGEIQPAEAAAGGVSDTSRQIGQTKRIGEGKRRNADKVVRWIGGARLGHRI